MTTQKIVNTPFPNDEEIGIEKMSVTYVQNADTNDDTDHYQYLTLETQSVPCGDTGELEYYVNISIPNFDDETPGHWSIDLNENLNAVLQDFKERLAYVNSDKCTKKEK